jgi:hypothetical protein
MRFQNQKKRVLDFPHYITQDYYAKSGTLKRGINDIVIF